MSSGALLLSAADRERLARVQRLAAAVPPSAELLIGSLDDPSWAVRREVVRALVEMGDAAIPSMCEALVGRRDGEARISALIEALVASRGSPEGTLLVLTASKSPAVTCDAAQILGRRHCAEALPALSALVEHADDNVSVSAIEALGRIGGQHSVERLIRVLETGAFFRVFPAIDVVGRLGDVRATATLVKLSGIPLYTLEAARALGRIGDLQAIPALAAMLTNAADSVVRTAAVALWEIHKQRFEDAATVAMLGPTRWMPAQADTWTRRLIEACKGADRAEKVAICHVLGWFATGDAIAALLGFLKIEGDIAEAAKAALARMRDSIDSELLLSLRTGGSVRRALLLPLVGRSPARPEVELCLTDPDPAVCAAACSALARLGDPAAVPALFALLGQGGAQVGQAAVNAILSLGSNETERLAFEAARSGNPQERRGAVRIVATLGYERGLAVLLAAVDDEDDRLRDIALPGLALLEDPKALDALLAAAAHLSTRTRTAAARALAQARPDSRVERALRVSLKDVDPWVRYYACHALGRRKDVASIEALVSRLDDDAGQVRIAAIEALSHMPGERAKQVLRSATTAQDPDLSRAALVGLGLLGEPDVLPTLLEAARSIDPATRLVALSALVGFKQPEAFDALGQAANDADEGVRTAAIGVLSTVPGQAATEALVRLISGRYSRTPALRALASPLEGRVPGLLEALERADDLMAGPLAATLARIQRADAGEGLVLALGSKNVAARRAAASVLRAAHSSKAASALANSAECDPDIEVRRLAANALER